LIPLLRRLLVVCLCGIAILLLLEAALTRDAVIPRYFALKASGAGADGEPVEWTFTVNEIGNGRLGDEAATVEQVVASVLAFKGKLNLTASGVDREANWEAIVNNGAVTLKGVYARHDEFRDIFRRTAIPKGFERTVAVTVADVLREAAAGNLPTPTRSKVSFPAFSYRDAFPDATDEPEYVITEFHQAPMLEDLDSMPARWRKHYGDSLPPVAERLPRNPAVVRGCDGIGRYGGVWRQVAASVDSVMRKTSPESFIRFDPAGRVQPCLAYKWEVTDNNRVYTFYLRKGQRWSDGERFTTRDILWVTNTLIGSAYWPSSPNWMMETDGHALLYAEDIKDWPALAAAILKEAGSEAPSMGAKLKEVDGERLLPLLRKIQPGEAPPELLQYKIIDRLNVAFRRPTLFDADVCRSADTESELAGLLAKGFSRLTGGQRERVFVLRGRNDLIRRAAADIDELAPAELNRLNLLMFRLHYRDWVEAARITKVKIEAVPDETGDDSHIIRFTFPRPNSIFLEKTATFMFYRGLFGIPKHYTGRFHPAGTNRFARSDVLDWTGLLELIGEQRRSSADSPGKRVWSMLPKQIRDRIADDPDAAESDGALQQKIVDALNEAFARRDFYRPEAYSGVDWEAIPTELIGEGFSYLKRDRAGRNLLGEMLIRNDRLARVRERGVEDLSDEELYEFNQSMFRAAYDRAALETPLVAVNREDGLNAAAARHPRPLPHAGRLALRQREDRTRPAVRSQPVLLPRRSRGEPTAVHRRVGSQEGIGEAQHPAGDGQRQRGLPGPGPAIRGLHVPQGP